MTDLQTVQTMVSSAVSTDPEDLTAILTDHKDSAAVLTDPKDTLNDTTKVLLCEAKGLANAACGLATKTTQYAAAKALYSADENKYAYALASTRACWCGAKDDLDQIKDDLVFAETGLTRTEEALIEAKYVLVHANYNLVHTNSSWAQASRTSQVTQAEKVVALARCKVKLAQAKVRLAQAKFNLVQAKVKLDGALTNLDRCASNLAAAASLDAAAILDVAATKLNPGVTTCNAGEAAQACFSLAQAAADLAYIARIVQLNNVHPTTTLDLAQKASCLAQAAFQVHTPTKKMTKFYQLIECGQYLKDECPKRKVIRELISNENVIHDQRRNFFMLVQGLLWTSVGFFLQSDGSYEDAAYAVVVITSLVGFVFSLVRCMTKSMAHVAIRRLATTLPDPYWPTPVIGLQLPDNELPLYCCKFQSSDSYECAFSCSPPNKCCRCPYLACCLTNECLVPGMFMLAWFSFGVWFLVK
jgi:hypothetical protein